MNGARSGAGGLVALGVGLTIAASGCYLGTSSARAGDGGAGGDAARGDGAAVPPSGLPCAVAQAVAPCLSCHVAGGSGPMALVTYADLIHPALSDPTKSVAELAVERMGSTTAPMPPRPAAPASAAAIAALAVWIADGYPRGDCGAPDAGALDAPSRDAPLALPDGGQGGLPCDVATAVRPCLSCHVPGGGGPMPLVTYADLTARSAVDPTKTVAERGAIRMQDTLSPMPPHPAAAASATDVAALQAWIAAGYPHGSCAPPDAGLPDRPPPPLDAGPLPDGGQSGLPCDVAAVLAACLGCHAPGGSAPIPLVTYENLVATSAVDATKTVAQRCVIRMGAATSPMPPPPNAPATSAAITTLQSWITAAYPRGGCGAPDGGVVTDPAFTAAPTCTSGTYTYGEDVGAAMHPGGACNSCHSGGDGPWFTIAGTVFHSGHEYPDCNGVAVGSVAVVITGSDLVAHPLSVNASGNFTYQGSLALPYTAKVVKGTQVRAMAATQTSGDCNACHTQAGANGAPGRIVEPW